MTLSVAAAVVFLAIYKEGIADQRMVLLSWSAFGVAVVFAVPGMVLVIVLVQFKIRASSTAPGLRGRANRRTTFRTRHPSERFPAF
jgi:ABC-type sulfate transport system permease subunit